MKSSVFVHVQTKFLNIDSCLEENLDTVWMEKNQAVELVGLVIYNMKKKYVQLMAKTKIKQTAILAITKFKRGMYSSETVIVFNAQVAFEKAPQMTSRILEYNSVFRKL